MPRRLAWGAAMILVEDGKIQLTDPISKFLPPMKNLMVSVPRPDAPYAKHGYALVPAEREPTVQDLLRHTAGLTYYERPAVWRGKPRRAEQHTAGHHAPSYIAIRLLLEKKKNRRDVLQMHVGTLEDVA